MVTLRSGKQTVQEDDSIDCRHFLSGEYPNLSRYTLAQLRHLKESLDNNFGTIQHEIANNVQEIKLLLLAQWRQYHEDLLRVSTPLNRNTYMTTYQAVVKHCNIKEYMENDSDDDVKFDDEFLCNICTQENCVGYGFRSVGVHSPSYGVEHSKYRTNEAAYNKSVIAKKQLHKNHVEFYDKNYGHMLLNQLL